MRYEPINNKTEKGANRKNQIAYKFLGVHFKYFLYITAQPTTDKEKLLAVQIPKQEMTPIKIVQYKTFQSSLNEFAVEKTPKKIPRLFSCNCLL